MIEIDIPGFGEAKLKHFVTDFSGTLSLDGHILTKLKDRLDKLAEEIEIHILTADTHGKARDELRGIKGHIQLLSPGVREDDRKEDYVRRLGAAGVVAAGNGNNDRKMLKAARIGIAVCIGEGCAADAIKAADIMVFRAEDAFDLLLKPSRLKATLRF